MGDDLEPVVLFDDARPGDKVTVAVKLLHTVDTKSFRGARLRIDFPENRPNPEDLREEFLSAALLVPSLAPGDAGQDGHAERGDSSGGSAALTLNRSRARIRPASLTQV